MGQENPNELAVAVDEKPRDCSHMLIAGALFGLLTVAVSALTAGAVTVLMQPAKSSTSTGTWICSDSTGGQTAVVNPANCGPQDLVQWCNVWVIDNPADHSGHCVE